VYRTELLETHALRDFSPVEPGEFVAVTGLGVGKTTFLNVTGLLETFETGTYRLDGDDVSRSMTTRAHGESQDRFTSRASPGSRISSARQRRRAAAVWRMAAPSASRGSIVRSISSVCLAQPPLPGPTLAGSSSVSRLHVHSLATLRSCWRTSRPAT
jgi:energy-coupling factor transporter ATP-binding protein EcfA2